MNNKLIGYDEAVKRLKKLESSQKFYKRILTKEKRPKEIRALYQSEIILRKDKINTLLSLIDAHKQARKLFGAMQGYYKLLEKTALTNANAFGVVNVEPKDD